MTAVDHCKNVLTSAAEITNLHGMMARYALTLNMAGPKALVFAVLDRLIQRQTICWWLQQIHHLTWSNGPVS